MKPDYLVNALVVLFNIEFISPTNIRLTRDGQSLHIITLLITQLSLTIRELTV